MKPTPQKKWGQNFLRNPGAADQIVQALEPSPEELILEIGPGEGVLTRRLATIPNRIVAWEIDPGLVERLRQAYPSIELVQTDATREPLPAEPYRAVGNLPYNVATPILRRVVASEQWRRAVFMFQKEVADKLTASPGDDEYGYLTITVGLRADARPLMTLTPGSFYPRPKVRSAVVVLEPATRDLQSTIEEVDAVASTAFRMRRKTLLNNLIGWEGMDRGAVTIAIESAGIEPTVRAETLGLAEFDRLAMALRR